MRCRLGALGALVAALLVASGAAAQQVSVGSGSTFSLSNASVDLGCSDLVVSGTLNTGSAVVTQALDVDIAGGGTLDGGSGTLDVTGDWTRTGSFNAGTGTVRFVDGCGTTGSTVTGATTFSNLSLQTSTGKQVLFTAGETTSVTGTTTLAGASGNLLQIRSTVNDSEAFLDLASPASGSFVDVKDNHAIGGAVTLAGGSLISGNATGWGFAASFVPALPLLGLGALGGALYLAGLRSLSRRPGAEG